MLDWLSGIERKNLESTHFVLSPLTFVQLLEGKADLDLSFFGTLSLPPLAAMKEALPDLVDRLYAIKEVATCNAMFGEAIRAAEGRTFESRLR